MSVTASADDLSKSRLLSSTCQYLRKVGLRYIFRSRTLSLDNATDWEPNPDLASYLRGVALQSRAKLLITTKFLLSRPDLTQSLRHLVVENHWSSLMPDFPLVDDFDIITIEPEFYTPILWDLGGILRASHNLTVLTLRGIDINDVLLYNISRFKNLHSVKYHLCQIPPASQMLLITGQVPISQTVLNLDLVLDPPVSWCLLYTLFLYPQLRTLLVKGTRMFDFPIPAEYLLQQYNLFQTLERVHLCFFDVRQISRLNGWLRTAAMTDPGLRLTHFKIHTRWGASDLEIFDLLDALQTAPLKVLVLDGLQDGEFELIDRISQTFPDLLGLTLVRRHNDRQADHKLTSWPHPSWAYAPHFSSFGRLLHFGWNFRCQIYDPTPSIMMQFENDFADCGKRSEPWDEPEEREDYFGDHHVMALPFAAHCVTLQSFAIVERYAVVVCSISRAPNGSLVVDSGPRNLALASPWNPRFTGWPPILPEGEPS